VPSLVETIQAIVREELRGVRVAELGLVEEVRPHRDASDADNYGCDVRLKNSGLLLKRVPVATGHVGTAAIPNVGDLVLLAFDKGDVNQPIVIGRLYDDADRPPVNDSGEVIFRLPLAESDDRSVLGAIRNHPGTTPPREAVLEMPPDVTLRITDGTVRAVAGKTEMTLDQPGASGGRVTVLSGRTRIVMDQDGDLTVEAAGAMTLKAARDLTLEGMNVKIKGQLKTDVEAGTQGSFKASLGATVDGGLASTVRGTSVSVRGLTSFSPS
jgi:phage baseplate assembly protein gpV